MKKASSLPPIIGGKPLGLGNKSGAGAGKPLGGLDALKSALGKGKPGDKKGPAIQLDKDAIMKALQKNIVKEVKKRKYYCGCKCCRRDCICNCIIWIVLLVLWSCAMCGQAYWLYYFRNELATLTAEFDTYTPFFEEK